MINMTWDRDQKTATWKSFTATDAIGDLVTTQRPGHIGHNYATWRVTNIDRGNEWITYTGDRIA